MAKNQTKPLGPKSLKEDTDVLAAVKGLKDYNPAKTDYTLDKLTAADAAVTTTTTANTQAEAALKTARDAMVAAQWARHNLLLGAKEQVVGQYGDDSEEAAGVGLKRKSERASPKRKSAATAAKKAA